MINVQRSGGSQWILWISVTSNNVFTQRIETIYFTKGEVKKGNDFN